MKDILSSILWGLIAVGAILLALGIMLLAIAASAAGPWAPLVFVCILGFFFTAGLRWLYLRDDL